MIGALTTLYTWGADGLVGKQVPGTTGVSVFYAYELQGSALAALNSSGNTVWTNGAGFNAWGVPLGTGTTGGSGTTNSAAGTTPTTPTTGASWSGDPVGFGGKFGYYTDPESGLILCSRRYYDPLLHRWVNRDPIGYDGGIDLYAYCENNPVMSIDPSGLDEVDDFFKPDRDLLASIGDWWNGVRIRTNNAIKKLPKYPCLKPISDVMDNTDPMDVVFAIATLPELPEELAFEAAFLDEDVVEMLCTGRKCFVAGTPVQMADGTTKPIEHVKEGDLVYSRNSSSGVTEAKHVEKTFVLHARELVTVRFAQEGDTRKAVVLTLQGTPEHPMFTPGVKMVNLGDLGVGSQIMTRAGPSLVVVSTTREKAAAGYTVYNFRVADDHTYFIGTADGGAWVHNADYVPDVQSLEDARNAFSYRDVRVATESEASQLAIEHFQQYGFLNTTGISGKDAIVEAVASGRDGYYHWGDIVEIDSKTKKPNIKGHTGTSAYGSVRHIQFHSLDRTVPVSRIFYGPNVR